MWWFIEKSIFQDVYVEIQVQKYLNFDVNVLKHVNVFLELLQIVMFSLYGNQYEAREGHLLLKMFEMALQMEFDETDEFGSLLRANTAISRMMSTYTR